MQTKAIVLTRVLLSVWLLLSGATVWADSGLRSPSVRSSFDVAALMPSHWQSPPVTISLKAADWKDSRSKNFHLKDSLSAGSLPRALGPVRPAHRIVRKIAANGISADQAIALAKQITPGRVLSVDKVQQGGKSVFRIKMLGANGRVSWVTLDAVTGAVVGN